MFGNPVVPPGESIEGGVLTIGGGCTGGGGSKEKALGTLAGSK